MLIRAPEHLGFGLKPTETPFSFAAEATAIPIVGNEFALTGRHYPIVFANDADGMPLAVTGVEAGRNVFVTADGHWRAMTYVPSYVRRYPFIGMTTDAAGTVMLGVDSGCGRLTADVRREGGEPLFELDGKPTDTSRAAIAFCEAYAVEHERSRVFVAALSEHSLLVERSVTIRPTQARNGADDREAPAEIKVGGFRLVDEAAFRALDRSVVADFYARGWLDLIVLRLASQYAWQDLAVLAELSKTTEAAPA
ncbi:SapC family protein [Rhizobiales bacterium Sp-1]|uniref:SapC family protein n=2 Tax=Segnochrobactrum spirostomi TaxID=2608987 RepID=A0A6A7Y846_9HYPH|nr:SapC family protein [Segnochrobactrum spirostomi]